MNIILSTAISFVIKWISNSQISGPQIDRIKALISDLEGRAIDSVIKHQSVADLVKTFAKNLSDTAVDTIVKLLLLTVRANA
jgi:hypothetical protein